MISVRQFAESRNEQPNTVLTYIRRHQSDFDGHVWTDNRKMMIDEYAVELLSEVYPLPAPVEVVVDTESREKLLHAQETIIRLQDALMESQNRVAIAESQKLLLEERKEHELNILKAESQMELDKKDLRIKELEDSLAREMNKTWLQKLFGK